jgi:hypothetical protein
MDTITERATHRRPLIPRDVDTCPISPYPMEGWSKWNVGNVDWNTITLMGIGDNMLSDSVIRA